MDRPTFKNLFFKFLRSYSLVLGLTVVSTIVLIWAGHPSSLRWPAGILGWCVLEFVLNYHAERSLQKLEIEGYRLMASMGHSRKIHSWPFIAKAGEAHVN